MDRTISIVPSAAAGTFEFSDSLPAVVAQPPRPDDDWHIDPATKQAAAEQTRVTTASAERVAEKNAKLIAKRGDGKASIVGASFNLSNAVSSNLRAFV